MGYLDYIKSFFRPQQYCSHVYTLGVVNEFRGTGLASTFFTYYKSKVCEKKKYKLVYLDCAEYNESAIKFYQKVGFQKTKVKQNYYSIYKKLYNSVELKMYLGDYEHYNRWLEKKKPVTD